MTIQRIFIHRPIHTFDPLNPTDPNNYHDMNERIKGVPVQWREDVSGKMPAAVHAYYNSSATEEQLQLVIAYIQHHIHAPCYLETPPWNRAGSMFESEIKELRALSLTLKTAEDISKYIVLAMDIALDPL